MSRVSRAAAMGVVGVTVEVTSTFEVAVPALNERDDVVCPPPENPFDEPKQRLNCAVGSPPTLTFEGPVLWKPGRSLARRFTALAIVRGEMDRVSAEAVPSIRCTDSAAQAATINPKTAIRRPDMRTRRRAGRRVRGRVRDISCPQWSKRGVSDRFIGGDASGSERLGRGRFLPKWTCVREPARDGAQCCQTRT